MTYFICSMLNWLIRGSMDLSYISFFSLLRFRSSGKGYRIVSWVFSSGSCKCLIRSCIVMTFSLFEKILAIFFVFFLTRFLSFCRHDSVSDCPFSIPIG